MNIELLQSICRKLPSVTEDIKWGNDLCFCIAGKIFCVAGLNPPLQVSMKVTMEEFEELISRPEIIPAPYMARYYWILVEETSALSKKEWEYYIKQSYNMVKSKLSKKLLKQYKMI